MVDEQRLKEEVDLGLTCIRECIHCAATQEGADHKNDDLEIDQFLDALAIVASAVARRDQET